MLKLANSGCASCTTSRSCSSAELACKLFPAALSMGLTATVARGDDHARYSECKAKNSTTTTTALLLVVLQPLHYKGVVIEKNHCKIPR